MPIEIFNSINPLDALFVLVLARILFIAVRRGPWVELFKFFGALFATCITLHYYCRLAEIFYRFTTVPTFVNKLLAFGLLWLVVTIVFKLLCEGVMILSDKKDDKPVNHQGLAVLFAIGRSFLVCGLIFTAVLVSARPTLVHWAHQARSAPALKVVSVGTYKIFYDTLVARLFPSEEFNHQVLLLQDENYLAE